MTPTIVLSPLDVLIASKIAADEAEHRVTWTTIGPACSRCKRVLDLDAWAAPCPGR